MGIFMFGSGQYKEHSVIYFEIGPEAQQDKSSKGISYLQLWWPFCSTGRKHLCNLIRGHYKKKFCEIIFNLDQFFMR